MWSMYGLYDASESVRINTPQLGIRISIPIDRLDCIPLYLVESLPLFIEKKNRAICRPFTAKRNVRKIFSSLARKLVFWCCDSRNFFLKGHIYGRFRILVILPVSAKFWAKQNWKTKMLYFSLKVFCFIFIAKNRGTVVRFKLFIDIFWTSFTHMLKIT